MIFQVIFSPQYTTLAEKKKKKSMFSIAKNAEIG